MRVVIAHGWAEGPDDGWIGWLVQELRQRGIEVAAPAFPEPKKPHIRAWLEELGKAVGELDEGLILVGHSLGVPLILRFLSDYPDPKPISGLIAVAGVVDAPVGRPNRLFDPPLDFDKIISLCWRRMVIHATNDHVIPRERAEETVRKLKAEEIKLADGGHFSAPLGHDEFPELLNVITGWNY